MLTIIILVPGTSHRMVLIRNHSSADTGTSSSSEELRELPTLTTSNFSSFFGGRKNPVSITLSCLGAHFLKRESGFLLFIFALSSQIQVI